MNIKERREQLGISQKELAERCGIAQSSLCDFEQGRCKPSLETTIRIAKELKIDSDAITDDSIKGYENLVALRETLLSK